ncbi:MAG TPA: toll/interleukin-1 receptor domain-containing protein [Burkholderiaceae bacterium]|nr:toll/interleukin-1 receptor domain-containing protein [Burkholderiaceae bacterium]
MGYVPGFEYDLFVSYAHIDDAADAGRQEGWVSVLKDNLRARLDRRLGIRSNIWMDQRLVSTTRLSPAIVDGLRQAAGLLVIVSPAYLNSQWCSRERGGFLDALRDPRSAPRPIFLAECDDLDRKRLPSEFGDLLGVRFWQRQTDGAAPQRLGDPLPSLEDRPYWDRLNDLAFKVSEELSRLKGGAHRSTAAATGPTVFLAEATDDLGDECERVQRSLEQSGLVVLPNRAYPRETPEGFAAAMADDLQRCKVFVQLLGEYPGRVRGWNPSLTALQLQTARAAGVPVMQWRRFELGTVKDDAHREIVFGPDVTNETLDVFVAGIIKAVQQEADTSNAQRDQNGAPLVFINHDQTDSLVAGDLCRFFDQHGLGFLTPTQLETADAMRADLEDNLKLCDGLVLIYGQSQPTWVRQQLKETIKIKSARERPIAQIVLCQAAPVGEKADPGIKLPNQRIVDCRRGIDANAQQALMEFVSSLRGGAR